VYTDSGPVRVGSNAGLPAHAHSGGASTLDRCGVPDQHLHDRDGGNYGIFAQRFDSAGVPKNSELLVNTFTRTRQRAPSVAAASDGAFVVVWESFNQDESRDGVFGQRFDGAGRPSGGEFQVNTHTREIQVNPVVAAAPGGDFVVVWSSYEQDGSDEGVFGQRYDSGGRPRGGEFRINTTTSSRQQDPAVGVASDGAFVVVWRSRHQDGDDDGVFGQRFDSTGARRGGEFLINSYTTGAQRAPAIAVAPAGDFVVVWHSVKQDGNDSGVFGQRFDGAGRPRGFEFQVNDYTRESQRFPAVTMTGDGGFVVTWYSLEQDGDDNGIFSKHFRSDGLPREPEFQVNTYTTGIQRAPALAAAPDGSFVVVWQSDGQDVDRWGVFGQRFGGTCGEAEESCDDGAGTGDHVPCELDSEACDDGDPCTGIDLCSTGRCVGTIATVAGLTCRLDEVRLATCGAESLPPTLVGRIDRKLRRASRFVEKAARAAAKGKPRKTEKFRRRALRQLAAITDATAKAVARRRATQRISEGCRDGIDVLVAESRRQIAGFDFEPASIRGG
jgi:hypothetical protein